ncbi:hypothetical protein H6770_02885 [Candidatus Peribacteria bacterium]|nr:hypothetical protein [Candidatus Peribacteria bacterium]
MALGQEKHGATLGEAILHQAGNDLVEGIDWSATREDPFNIVGDTIRNGTKGVRNAAKVVIGDLIPRAPDWIVDKFGSGEQRYDVTHRNNVLSGTGSYVKDIAGRKGVVRKVGAAVLNTDKVFDDGWNMIGSGKWQIRPSKN